MQTYKKIFIKTQQQQQHKNQQQNVDMFNNELSNLLIIKLN